MKNFGEILSPSCQRIDHQKEEMPLNYMESLDLADKDINDNWDIYRERFLRGDFP